MRPLSMLTACTLAFAALCARPSSAKADPHESDRDESPCSDDDDRGDSIDATVQVKPGAVIDIHQFGGNVHVTTWPASAVHVKGQFRPGCHVDVTPSGEREEIRLECSHGPAVGDIEVQVPQTSSLDVRTMSADLVVQGTTGSVHLETVSGDIELKGGAPSELEVRTTSGDVTVQSAAAATRVHAISGDVRIAGVRGRAQVRTVSGDCTLSSGGDLSSLEFQSVSGDLVFTGGITSTGAVDVQTHSGDVGLHLPPTTGADVEMSTHSGDLVIDMGSGRKTGEETLNARIGPGGSRLRLRSFSGDIRVTQ